MIECYQYKSSELVEEPVWLVMDQLYKVLNILEVQFPWAACQFTAWSDYITSVLVEPSNAEECTSREADTVKDFMIPGLLVRADGSEFDVGRDLSVDHYCDSCVLMTCNH
jgi:hypothetical protein